MYSDALNMLSYFDSLFCFHSRGLQLDLFCCEWNLWLRRAKLNSRLVFLTIDHEHD